MTTQPTTDDIQSILDAHATREGPLLPILHAFMEAWDHIPEAAIAPTAKALRITEAELHGVISFYHDFRRTPGGTHRLKICRAEACQAMGVDAVSAAVLDKLGLDWGGTTADGKLTIEPVYCLGLCACAPAAMLDDRPVGRVDGAKLDALIAEAQA